MKLPIVDIGLLHRYPKGISIGDVFNEITGIYKLKNVYEGEDGDSYWDIAEILWGDIEQERANYRAYIKVGMDARVLLELRKTMVLPVIDELEYLYSSYENCETAKDIKETRIRDFKFLNDDYNDEDWQYYGLMRYILRKKSVGMEFNYEMYYADCNESNYRDIDYIREEFLYHVGVTDVKYNFNIETTGE